MQWLGPDVVASNSRWPVLLSICPNLDRMQSREHALHAAGYSVASASRRSGFRRTRYQVSS